MIFWVLAGVAIPLLALMLVLAAGRRTAAAWLLFPTVPLLAIAFALGDSPFIINNSNVDVDADAFIRAGLAGVRTPRDSAPDAAAPAADEEPPADQESAPPSETGAAGGGDEIDLADDIVRRYRNDTYNYSLELVCSPFCNPLSVGVDFVGFFSESGLALIRVEVVDPEGLGLAPGLEALEARWRDDRDVNDTFQVVRRQEGVLGSDGRTSALHLTWEIDRRAADGFQERFHSLIVQVGPLAYFVEAGAVFEEFDGVEPSLLRALDSFIASPNPPSRPGLYGKFDFVFPYAVGAVIGELGNPGASPTFQSGVFLQQSDSGETELFLIWDSLPVEFFDPELSVTDIIASAGAQFLEEVDRGDLLLSDGVTGHFGLVLVQDPDGGQEQVGVFAWYCADTERSFVLQSFSRTDARAVAQPSLDGFRCAQP